MPAVSRALADFVETGLVLNIGPVAGGLGRRPHGYRVNERYRYIVSVDLGQVPAVIALGTLTCRVLERVTVDLTGLQSVSGALTDEIRRLAHGADLPLEMLAAVTVANPGIVDPDTGAMQHPAETATWPDDPIRTELSRELGLPVLVMNDVKMATIGELYRGAGKGINDFVFLRMDVGVNVGIVHNGRLISGADNAAGEVGSLRLGGGREVDQRLEDWLIIGRPDHGSVVERMGHARLEALGELLGLIAALLNPTLVLLGGRLGQYLDEATLEALRARVARHCVSTPPVALAEHGLDGALIGGMSLAADHFLSVFSSAPQGA